MFDSFLKDVGSPIVECDRFTFRLAALYAALNYSSLLLLFSFSGSPLACNTTSKVTILFSIPLTLSECHSIYLIWILSS